MRIRDLIKQERAWWIETKGKNRGFKSPKDINCGDCYNFAQHLKKKIKSIRPSAKVRYCEDTHPQYSKYLHLVDGHGWIKVNDKFYDSEAPNGVKKWTDLPIYKRNIKKYGHLSKEYLRYKYGW